MLGTHKNTEQWPADAQLNADGKQLDMEVAIQRLEQALAQVNLL